MSGGAWAGAVAGVFLGFALGLITGLCVRRAAEAEAPEPPETEAEP